MARTRSLTLAAVAVVVALVAAGCVSGPLPILPPSHALAVEGYVEHEYFLDGIAHSYTAVGSVGHDGRWSTKQAASAPFRTRLVVRRPADPTKFNGTVYVEWLNVSSGTDIDPTFAEGNAAITRAGAIWVGVSAQQVGIDALRKSNPSRYGSLHTPGDDYSYDIFTQAGAALRKTTGTDPLEGLHGRRFIAFGESQSAFRMVTYINAIQPVEHTYDGFLVYSRGDDAAQISSTGPSAPSPSYFRTDQHTPVIDVQTETDVVSLDSAIARQSDNKYFRLWEVAGGSHVDEHTLSRTFPSTPTTPGSTCTYRLNSANTWTVVSSAAIWLDRWVRGSTNVPHAARIATGPDLTVADPVLRDTYGNAQRGIRLPELEVPIARIDGLPNPAAPNTPPLLERFCFLFGRTIPFHDARLARLYPTHTKYVHAYDLATDRAVSAGFVLSADGTALKKAAAASTIGG